MNSGGTHLTQTRQVTQHTVLEAEGIQPPAGIHVIKIERACGSEKTGAGPGFLGTAHPVSMNQSGTTESYPPRDASLQDIITNRTGNPGQTTCKLKQPLV